MTPSVSQLAVQLAEEHFGDNLALAFVGGSYARHTPKPTSDIDVFVVLRRSDHATERTFAQALKELHARQGLSFDHCGEVFDTATLEALLTFTEQAIAAVPAIQDSACYQADCPLSVFRKGDVVFKFLADPKIHVRDRDGTLPALEKRATRHFEQWPRPRIQEHKGHPTLPANSRQAGLAHSWRRREATSDWADTPVGIGLDRWFGAGLLTRTYYLPTQTPVTTAPISPQECPLPMSAATARRVYAAQCLAFSHTVPEGS